MFSKTFIERPKFAMVISIVLSLAGALSLFSLPISLYPKVTPPVINISASYPGASAEVVSTALGIPIEEEINGVEGMIYMDSSSSLGRYSLSVTFETDVDANIAQVQIQNRLEQATSRLPEEVIRQGIRVRQRSSDALARLVISSPKGTKDLLYLADYAENNIKKSLMRVAGVSDMTVYASKYAMRVWLDANKITALGLSVSDIQNAIKSQNMQASLGSVGMSPAKTPVEIVYNLETKGRLNTLEDFENIVIHSNTRGGFVRLKDIADVEMGAESNSFSSEFGGSPAVSSMVSLLSGANALSTMQGIRKDLERLKKMLPEDVEVNIAFDYSLYIEASIKEVVVTLILTFVLVLVVCYIFLQDIRATLIPILTIPVSLLSTFAVLSILGYSINMLTLFGLILAIGLVVDDAIVVVERVLAIMETQKKPPREATIQAMEEVSSAVIATTLVLLAIFVPVAFLGGIPGQIYKQFAVAISTAVVFSSLNALTLSPALCATILKPLKERKSGFLHIFNEKLKIVRNKYVAMVGLMARKTAIILLLFALFIGGTYSFLKLSSTSFLPSEDQGTIFAAIQLPEGASKQRTLEINRKVYDILKDQDGIDYILNLWGWSFIGGNGENLSSVVITLKPWNERTDKALYSSNIAQTLRQKLSVIKEAKISVFEPAAIPGLSRTGGIDMRLQAFEDTDPKKLDEITQSFLAKANALPEIANAFSSYTAKTPSIFVNVDREKAVALSVDVGNIFKTLKNYLGSSYVNDVNFGTQVNQVILQADWKYRKNLEAIDELYILSNKNHLIPLRSLIELKTVLSPRMVERYNQYPSASINAITDDAYSSGQAMTALSKLAEKELPQGYGFEWSGMSFQEQASQGQVSYLIILALIFAYLFLVAQYESWSTPVPVLLSVFIAMIGALAGLYFSQLPLSIYAQLGLVLLVGLATKNAILIVEFAQTEKEHGTDLIKSAMTGTKERFRAVLMTAFTFILGVFPMVIATGAGASSRQAIGVPVFYGMLISTVLGLLAIPLLYVLTYKILGLSQKQKD